MAVRRQEKSLTRRYQVDVRNTFDYTTPALQVVAGPTDPYFQPIANPQLRQLIDALGTVSSSLQAYSSHAQKLWEEEYEKGRLARAAGEELPSRSEAMQAGWYALSGELAARTEYKPRLLKFLEENLEASPEEFAEGLNAITQEFLDHPSEHYLRGFALTALSIEEDVLNRYHAAQRKRVREASLDKITQKARDEAESMVLEIMGPIFGVQSLSEIVGNQEIYDAFSHGDFGAIYARDMREALSRTQALAQDLGIHRKDVSEIYVNVVGRMAVELGLPELLSFADLRDESGVSIAGGTLGEVVERYRAQAGAARERYVAAFEKQAEQERRIALDRAVKDLEYNIALLRLEPDSMRAAEGAVRLRHQLANDPTYADLPRDVFVSLLNKITDIEQGSHSLTEHGNELLYSELYLQAVTGEVSLEDIETARAEYQLSLPQYKTLIDKWWEWEERRRRGEVEDRPDRQHINALRRQFINLIGGVNDFGAFTDEMMATSVIQAFAQREMEWFEKNGRNPSYWEWVEEILEPILSRYNMKLSDIRTYGLYVTDPDARPSLLDDTPPWVIEEQRREEERRRARSRARAFVEDRISPFLSRFRFWAEADLPDPSPEWRLGPDRSFAFISEALAAGLTLDEIVEGLRRGGESDEAIEWYLKYYPFMYAREALHTVEAQLDPVTVIDEIRRDLMEQGFSEEEIDEAIQAARWKPVEE